MNGREKRHHILHLASWALMLLTIATIATLYLKTPTSSTIQLPPNHYAIFAYGSLLNKTSMERTLGRTYDGPLIPAEIKGWKRSWSIRYPNDTYYYEEDGKLVYPENIIYLNIEKNEESVVNGIIFIVSEKELREFDKRELVYDRIKVTHKLTEKLISGGPVYTYVAKPEYFIKNLRATTETAIRKEYIDIVSQGAKSLGTSFHHDFEKNSAAIPTHIVVDAKRDESTPYTGIVSSREKSTEKKRSES